MEKAEDVAKAWEKALVLLYNDKSSFGIDKLSYKRFHENIVKSSKYVMARDLPLAASAAKFNKVCKCTTI